MPEEASNRELIIALRGEIVGLTQQVNSIINRFDRIENREITSDRIKNIESYIYDLQNDKLDKAIFCKDDKTKLESRITSLENWRWYILGMASIFLIVLETMHALGILK